MDVEIVCSFFLKLATVLFAQCASFSLGGVERLEKGI